MAETTIVKKDGEKFVVYDKTNTHTELEADGKEVTVTTRVFHGEESMLKMDIDHLKNNIARQQTELASKEKYLAAITASKEPK